MKKFVSDVDFNLWCANDMSSARNIIHSLSQSIEKYKKKFWFKTEMKRLINNENYLLIIRSVFDTSIAYTSVNSR